jgi:hypothetical protein
MRPSSVCFGLPGDESRKQRTLYIPTFPAAMPPVIGLAAFPVESDR